MLVCESDSRWKAEMQVIEIPAIKLWKDRGVSKQAKQFTFLPRDLSYGPVASNKEAFSMQ